MKKILATALSIIMVFSLCSCENNDEVETYCNNCGQCISNNVDFCEHCGVEINNNTNTGNNTSSENSHAENEEDFSADTGTPTDTTIPSNSSIPSDSSIPSSSSAQPNSSSQPNSSLSSNSSKPSNTSESSTPTHTHSYSKKITSPTCTQQGYTTYSCSCGHFYISDYTNISSHSYSKYVCITCGAIDTSHPYEYLMEWVKSNGNYDGKNITYKIQQRFSLSYSPEYNNLFLDCYMTSGASSESYAMLQLDSYFYGFSFYGDSIYGYINASTYTQSSSLTYVTSDCKTFTPDKLLPTAKTAVNVLIEALRNCLLTNRLPITIADLGLKSY